MGLFNASCRNRVLYGVTAAVVLLASYGSTGPSFISEAQAKKIVITHTSIYINTLPKGCVKTMYGNVTVWRCGTVYYQPYKGRYVRVYIN